MGVCVSVCIIVVDVVCVVMLGMYDYFIYALDVIMYFIFYLLYGTPGRLVVPKAAANGDPSNKQTINTAHIHTGFWGLVCSVG